MEEINVGDFVVCNCGACPDDFWGPFLVRELAGGMVGVGASPDTRDYLNLRNSFKINLTEDELLGYKLGVFPCLKKDDPRLKK